MTDRIPPKDPQSGASARRPPSRKRRPPSDRFDTAWPQFRQETRPQATQVREASPILGVAEALALATPVQGSITGAGDQPTLILFFSIISPQSRRLLTYAQAWHERYQDAGLIVVGVHCPELERTDSQSALRMSLQRWKIRFPVLHDPHRQSWQAMGNPGYDSCHLFKQGGSPRAVHDASTPVRQIELDLQSLLHLTTPQRLMDPLFPEDLPGATRLQASPDRHLGMRLGEIANIEGFAPHNAVLYQASGPVGLKPMLDGGWESSADALISRPDEGHASLIELRCQARSVYAVAESETPALLRVEAKGRPQLAPIPIRELGLYCLLEGKELAAHHLRLSTDTDGLHLYMLRFTTEARMLHPED